MPGAGDITFFDGQVLRGVERRQSGKWPRYVAEFRNDGVGVFVVSAELVTALAAAVVENVARMAGSTGGFELYCRQCCKGEPAAISRGSVVFTVSLRQSSNAGRSISGLHSYAGPAQAS